MIVTIPARTDHEGIFSVELNIRDYCIVCGGKRGSPYNTLSYGHVDTYENIRKEFRRGGEFRYRSVNVPTAAYWREETEKCAASPYYFMTKYCLVNGQPFTTAMNEEEFNKHFNRFANNHTQEN